MLELRGALELSLRDLAAFLSRHPTLQELRLPRERQSCWSPKLTGALPKKLLPHLAKLSASSEAACYVLSRGAAPQLATLVLLEVGGGDVHNGWGNGVTLLQRALECLARRQQPVELQVHLKRLSLGALEVNAAMRATRMETKACCVRALIIADWDVGPGSGDESSVCL